MGELTQPAYATVPADGNSFQFEGKTYGPGDTLTTTDACRLVDFAQAYRAANPGAGIANRTPKAFENITENCPAGAPGTPGDTAAGAGTPGDPAQHGGDSATDQGAPALTNPPLQADGSPASPSDTVPSQSDEPRRPPVGQTDPAQVRETPQAPVTVAEPVDAFSGSYVAQETDLEVPNTILPLAFVRSYRSGVSVFGPLGWNWDHNFNVYLRELATGDVAVWRTLHEDVFTFDGVRHEPPRGIFDLLERQPGPAPRWVLRGPGGTGLWFERPGGWVDGERIPLVRIEDRHGNALRLSYGERDHLVEVRDDDDRFLHFDYDECGLLIAVSDHAGRRYVYTHDEETFHLETVTTPPTADHAAGIRRRYHYADPGARPELRHNIVRVEDSSGRSFLENAYDEDPASLSFARVTEQRFGAYLYQYQYTELQVVPADDAYVNVPARQVEVMNPDYGVETYTFNFRGDLLDERFRLVKDRSFRIVAIQYAYDRHGNRAETTRSDGSQELRTYDSSNPDPRMCGVLLRRELTAAAGFPVPSRIVWRGRYEPVYQLLVDEHDEAGALTTYEYDFHLTPGALTNTGKLKRVTHPDATLPDGTVQAAQTLYEHDARGMVTASIDPNGVRTEYGYGAGGAAAGRLVSRTQDAGGLAATERYEYDAYGHRDSVVDALGRRTVKTFNALGQVEKVTLPAVGGLVAGQVIHYDDDRRVAAFERPRGTYDDPVLAGAAIVDRVTRDVLGNPTSVVLAANTIQPCEVRSQFDHRGYALRSINPDGSRADRVYDERGRLVSDTITGSDGAQQSARTSYDVKGNLTRSVGPGGAATTYEYDGFGRLRLVTTPNNTQVHRTWGSGDVLARIEVHGADDTGAVRLLAQTDYAYDERRRRIRETVKSFDDDPAAAVDVTIETFYDTADRAVRIVDQRGAATSLAYDDLGRLVGTTDPMGNVVESDYDLVGNLLAVRRRDVDPGGGISVIAIRYEYDERDRRTATVLPEGSRRTVTYDDRDLPVLETDPLGVPTEIDYDACNVRVAERHDPGGLAIVHRWHLDTVGRTVAYVDPEGATTSYALDGLGRRVTTVLPDGQTSTRSYNTAGNVEHEVLASGVQFHYDYDAANRLTGLRATVVPVGFAATADHMFTYDGLDRLVQARYGPDQVTRRFDSRGRLRRERSGGVLIAVDYDDLTGAIVKRFPDGRVEETATDLGGRPTTFTQTATGAGLGTGNGVIATLTSSGPDHLGSAALRGGTTVTARYDDRKRLVALRASSGGGLDEGIAYRYDAADRRRLEALDGVAPDRSLYQLDRIARVTECTHDYPLALGAAVAQPDQDAAITAAVAGAGVPAEAFAYDAADARTSSTRAGQPPTAYVNSPGHAPLSAGAEAFDYSADGVRRSDGQLRYEHDALGRIVAARLGPTAVCRIDYDALGRPSVLHEVGSPSRALSWFAAHVEQEVEGGQVVLQHTRHPVTGALLARHVAGTTHFPLFDGRANLVALLDDGGSLLEAYRYETFGAPTIFDGAGAPITASAYGVVPVFGGQRYLPSAGRYLSTRRLMDPRHGVFLSGDPLGYVTSPSLYAYAAQDPVDLIDPDGEFAFLAILAVVAIGAVVAGGLNAIRQGIQMAENPARRAQGFDWGELFSSMGKGAALAPALVVAPELAIPLAGLGVVSGVNEMAHGNYATGTFDIVTSLAPFGFKSVRASAAGEGTLIGQFRGLGPSTPWTGPGGRFGRFDAINQSLINFRPTLFGRKVGPGIARPQGATAGGHAGVLIEDAEGRLTLFHKNAQPSDVEGWKYEAAWEHDSPPPEDYWFGPGRPRGPWSYSTVRVPSSTADAMSGYAIARQARPEEFVFYERSCSNFAADVLGEGGFRGFTPQGRSGASGLWQAWSQFAQGFNVARNMAYSAGFWSNAHMSVPNAKCKTAD